jgi:hypothetical protein
MIELMLMKKQIKISNEVLKKTLGHVTYAFVKDGQYLYVGSSKRGLKRLSDPAHVAASNALASGADLILIPAKDYGEALRNERRMMEQYQPSLNCTLDRPKLPVLDSAALQCLNKKCLHRWTMRTAKPQRCPKCGRRLDLQK